MFTYRFHRMTKKFNSSKMYNPIKPTDRQINGMTRNYFL